MPVDTGIAIRYRLPSGHPLTLIPNPVVQEGREDGNQAPDESLVAGLLSYANVRGTGKVLPYTSHATDSEDDMTIMVTMMIIQSG
jgi:hypothetical protein